MAASVDTPANARALAVRTDDIGPGSVDRQARNAKLGSVGACEFVLRVKQRLEWQAVPASKAAMALNAVAAAAQDGAAGALVVLGAVAKAACFPGTPRGPSLVQS